MHFFSNVCAVHVCLGYTTPCITLYHIKFDYYYHYSIRIYTNGRLPFNVRADIFQPPQRRANSLPNGHIYKRWQSTFLTPTRLYIFHYYNIEKISEKKNIIVHPASYIFMVLQKQGAEKKYIQSALKT